MASIMILVIESISEGSLGLGFFILANISKKVDKGKILSSIEAES